MKVLAGNLACGLYMVGERMLERGLEVIWGAYSRTRRQMEGDAAGVRPGPEWGSPEGVEQREREGKAVLPSPNQAAHTGNRRPATKRGTWVTSKSRSGLSELLNGRGQPGGWVTLKILAF